MALGGGSYTTQNKVLPGTYINFVSAAAATASLSDRGICTMPLELDWGPDEQVFTVTNEDFQKNSKMIFGYAYDSDKLKGLRDLFLNAVTLYAYRLNSGGKKASSDIAEARYAGTRGNDITISVSKNVDEPSKFDVVTYLDASKVDSQTVANAKELAPNDYVVFKADAELTVAAGIKLSDGTNGTTSGESHQKYLDKIESFAYNAMGVVVEDEVTKRLYVSFVKRLRDEMGIKFQLVLYNYKEADHMGVISVKNKVLDDGESAASLVYWTTGAECGCSVSASVQNRVYDGEFEPDTDYTQTQLKTALQSGEFVFHNVSGEVRVLDDINTMVTTTDTQGDVFKDNQTIRVIDQIANDDAVLFNTKYLGKMPNNQAGRTALWTDLVKLRKELQRIGAIENFNESDVKVLQGDTKKAVVVENAVTVVNAMSKMYMTVTIS